LRNATAPGRPGLRKCRRLGKCGAVDILLRPAQGRRRVLRRGPVKTEPGRSCRRSTARCEKGRRFGGAWAMVLEQEPEECVKGGKPMRTIAAAILVSAIGVASTADAAPKQQRPVRPVPFAAEAAFGENVEILKHGPLTVSLLCIEAGGYPSGRSPWSAPKTTC
jgi:hypothetical protein